MHAPSIQPAALGSLPLALSVAARPALAHGGDPGEPVRAALLGSFEPWVLAFLALALAMYAVGLVRLWRRAGIGRGIRVKHALAFAAGWLALSGALVSPLDALGTRLFSAHMLQHELLMIVAAPLLVIARPLAAATWALPARLRTRIGAGLRRPGWRRAWTTIRAPFTAWLLHASALWLWHAPALFDAALQDAAVHALQHLSFLGSALLFWWATLAAPTRRAQGIALLCLFTTMIHSGILGALLTLSPYVWYSGYLSTTATLGIDALQDQQFGGLLMWVPAALAYLGAGLALAARWLDADHTAACAARPTPDAR